VRSAQHLYIYEDDEACTYTESYDTNDFKTSKAQSIRVCGDVIV
jgi:hypothetical protein